MEQKLVLASCHSHGKPEKNLLLVDQETKETVELSDLFAENWRLVRESPMGGEGGNSMYASLLVFEREEQA